MLDQADISDTENGRGATNVPNCDSSGLPAGSRREASWISGLTGAADEGDSPEHGARADINAKLRRIVGERVVDARVLSGMAQHECALALGWSNPTQMSLIEAGKRLPPIATLIQMSELLGVTTDYLLGLENEPDRDPREAARRAALRHVRHIMETAAGGITDAVYGFARAEIEGSIAPTVLLAAADAVVAAIERFRELNASMFDDARNGAMVLRTVAALAEAAAGARSQRQRHDKALELALRRAKAANDSVASE